MRIRERWLWQTPEPGGGTPPATPPAPAATPPAAPPATPPPPEGGTPPVTPPTTPPPPAMPEGSSWEKSFPGLKPDQVMSFIQLQQAELAKLKAAPAAPATPPAPPVDMRELILEDPERALDLHLQKRLGPALGQLMESQAAITADLISTRRNEKGELTMPHFKKYEQEIRQFVGTVDSKLRHRPETWENAYRFVVGNHIEDIVQERIAGMTPAVEPAGGRPAPTRAASLGLSPEEERAALRMGMTPEDYVAARDASGEYTGGA